MKRILLAFLLLGAYSAEAQVVLVPNFQPDQQLKAFLALTDVQQNQILLNLKDYSDLISQRQQRVYQVQSEIRDETAKSPLNPAALGIRYAEIETICRNVRDEGVAVQNRNIALLTEAQKAKLKILDDALKLQPVIAEAQNAGVLAASGPAIITGQWFNTTTFVGANVSGCQQIYDPLTTLPYVAGRQPISNP